MGAVLTVAWSAITSKIAGPLLAVLLAIVLGMFAFREAYTAGVHASDQKSIASISTQLTAADKDLATCKANSATLQHSLDDQNAAVAALKAESDQRTAAAQQAVDAAAQATTAANANAAAILAAKPGPNACVSALDLIGAH